MIRIPCLRKPPTGNNVLPFVRGLLPVVVATVSLICGLSVRALVINPIYDSSVTSNPKASAIKATINSVIQDYQTRFTDPVTVTIQFMSVSDGLGSSQTAYSTIDYATYRSLLVQHATTTNDTTALAHLPTGSKNPVNGGPSVDLTLPNQRALGLVADPSPGEPDSTISLNLSVMNFTRTGIDPNKYDLAATAYHEINEVLGLNSNLDGLNNGDPAPTDSVGSLDLFRYGATGLRSFNTQAATRAFLSLDGQKNLVQFNQDSSGDFHDWFSIDGTQVPRVQDAFGAPGLFQNQSDVELIALDVIGYTPRVVSPPTLVISHPAVVAGRFGFDLTGAAGTVVVIDASTSLKTWAPIATNTLTGVLHFTDPQTGAQANRAYRARTQ